MARGTSSWELKPILLMKSTWKKAFVRKSPQCNRNRIYTKSGSNPARAICADCIRHKEVIPGDFGLFR